MSALKSAWKGFIQFSMVTIPIKLYHAVDSGNTFVNADEIDTKLYDTPYYVGPDGDVGSKVFALMAQALTDTGKFGVGKVVLRDREDMVLVGAQDNRLVIYKVRYPQFIRDMSDVPGQMDAVVTPDELQLATSLIDSMSMPLADVEMTDNYYEAVRSMLESKVDGTGTGQIMPAAISKEPAVDIMTALRDSIAAAGAKPMEKAPAKKKVAAKKKTPAKKKIATKKRKAA
jgi:DNA end-binding protein Ku